MRCFAAARNASALFATALRHKVFCLCALSFCCTPATATTTAAMDLFIFYAPSGVLLCKPCGYAVLPTALATHISIHHLSDARNAATSSLASSKSKKPAELLANHLRERFQLLDPATAKIPTPPLTDPPIPELRLHCGYQCTRCEFIRLRTKTALVQMGTHFNQHRLLPRKKGMRQQRIADIPEEDKGPAFKEISPYEHPQPCPRGAWLREPDWLPL
jgi:hypothetical protein